MPDDGTIDFSGYGRAQLAAAIHTIDVQRFPVNHQHLSAEVLRRFSEETPLELPPPKEVPGGVSFDALPKAERRDFFRECMKRVVIVQIQLGIAIAIAFFAIRFLGVAFFVIGGGREVPTEGPITKSAQLIAATLLTYAAFWSYTRWLLRFRTSMAAMSIVRLTPEAPNSAFERPKQQM